MGKTDLDYSATARAFDAVAPVYDLTYGPEANRMMAWMREENLSILGSTFTPGSRLLEIGCGTGEEAIALARRGYHVTATDISPGMVAITEEKAAAASLSEMVTTAVSPAGRLQELQSGITYDGAFASFGSLNCEPNIAHLGTALASLLKKGSFFVCSFMPRLSPFEITWFLLHARPGRAMRRTKPGWQIASVSGRGNIKAEVLVRYLSPRIVQNDLGPFFAIVRSVSLGLLLPPPYLDDLYRGKRQLWRILEPIERRLRASRPWNSMGDHIVMVFQKT